MAKKKQVSQASQESAQANVRVVGFDDQTVVSREFGDRPDMFKVEAGRVDYIRILTAPVQYFIHAVNRADEDGNEAVFYLNCIAPIDAIQEDDPQRCAAECPACAQGYDAKDRYVMMVLWLWSEKNGRRTNRMQPLPWSVPGSRYVQIREIAATLANSKEKRTMMQEDLKITCTDTKWQKCNIMLNNTQSEIPKDVVVALKGEHIAADGSAGNPFDWVMIKEIIKADTKRDMVASLRRAKSVAAASADPLAGGKTGTGGGRVRSDDDPMAALSGGDDADESPNDDSDESSGDELDALLGSMG